MLGENLDDAWPVIELILQFVRDSLAVSCIKQWLSVYWNKIKRNLSKYLLSISYDSLIENQFIASRSRFVSLIDVLASTSEVLELVFYRFEK